MIITSIIINDFKSFRQEHTIDLSGGPGLYFLRGENRLSSRLGANGAGKSTIWDAVCWCLYGKSMRGQTAKTLHNWKASSKGYSVAIHVTNDGGKHVIRRTWNPNSLTITSDNKTTEVDDTAVVDFIGLTNVDFLNSVTVGQFSTLFSDLPPAAKMTMLSELLDLDVWMKRSARATAMVTEVQDDIDVINSIVDKSGGRLEALEATLEENEELQQTFKADHVLRLKEAKQKAATAKTKGEAEKAKLAKAEADVVKLTKKAETLMDKINSIDTKEAKFDEWDTKLATELASLETTRDHLNVSVVRMEGLASQCPTCNQKVSAAHIKTEKKKYQTKIQTIDGEIAGVKTKQEEATVAYNKRIEARNVVVDQYNTAHEEAELQESNARNLRTTLQTFRHQWTSANDDVKRINGEVSPYADLITDKKTEIKAVKDKLKTAKNSLGKYNIELATAKFWVTGFKHIRLMLVEKVLTYMELQVNNCLIQLGMEGWEIKFEVEKETQKGTVMKGFQTMIRSPESKGWEPWASWSGGETQRLRIAGAIGMADIITNSRAVVLGLEVWDEPSQHLSPEGMEDLPELLYNRAVDLDKQVWLVDHHVVEYGGFEEVVTVVKDRDGSSVFRESKQPI